MERRREPAIKADGAGQVNVAMVDDPQDGREQQQHRDEFE